MSTDQYSAQKIFTPSFIKKMSAGNTGVEQVTLSGVPEIAKDGSKSVDFTDFADGFRSTQQLPIEWSNFANHTFFDSAESKTNVAFDSIINYFPFDSNRSETNKFLDGLTGFEKWIYDSWPKNIGYLNFSGTLVNENPSNGYQSGLGTYITVQD